MLLLDMMRNKEREENERKKVRQGIRDNQSTPIMRLWPKRAQHIHRRAGTKKFFQEARIREMALEQKKKKEAERGIQVLYTSTAHI